MNMLQRWMTRSQPRSRTRMAGDRLPASCGPEASDMARIMAFRAGAGLLHEPEPGFWAGVAHVVGHGIGMPDDVRTGANLLVP